MKPPFRAAALLALLLPAAGRAHAQGEDALLLPRGVVEARAQGTFTHFNELFGSSRVPLGSFFDTPFAASAFSATATVRDSLQRVFDATRARTSSGAFTVAESDVRLGTYTVNLSAEQRSAPLSLRLGVTNWLTLGVSVPIEYRSTEVDAAHMVDAAIGPNPDPTKNRAVLAAIDSSFGAFGGGAYLPLRDSPAGQELLRRYALLRKIPTDSLLLPVRGINQTELTGLLQARANNIYPFNNQTRRYAPGDVEFSARIRLLNTTGATFEPQRGRSGIRVAAEGAFRLPTGKGSALDSLTEVPTTSGQGGASGALMADVFRGRFWVSAAGRYSRYFARDVVRHFYLVGNPFTAEPDSIVVSRTPGDRLELGLTPRFRLTDEISLAGRYAFLRQGALSYSDAPPVNRAFAGIESTEAQTAQLAGVGLSYSTLAAFSAGRANVPYEFSLLYEGAITGDGGAPAITQITLSGRVFVRAWGGTKRPHAPKPDTAAARRALGDTAAARRAAAGDTTAARRPSAAPPTVSPAPPVAPATDRTSRPAGTSSRVIPKEGANPPASTTTTTPTAPPPAAPTTAPTTAPATAPPTTSPPPSAR